MDQQITRRILLGAAGLGAAGVAVGGTAARATVDSEWTTRAKFDAFDRGFNGGNGRKTEFNENRGAVAWGESYVLQGYLLMWEAYRVRYYLDKAIDHLDHVLATRDSARGVTDWRGLSLAGWRCGWPYSAGDLILADVQGRPTLRLRSAWAFAESMHVTVSAGTLPDTFKISTHHDEYNTGRVHDNLTMDPASANYAIRRIYDRFDGGQDQLTGKDLRATPDAAGDPAPMTGTMHSSYFHSSVHTGQIAYPLAWFARIVHTTPQLRAVRRYRDKAREYIVAAEVALAIHDEEYMVTDGGAGYYSYLRDVPNNLDGSDLPHNYNTGPARAYLELVMAGRRWHRRRAEELVRGFVDDLQPLPDGSASWTYYRTIGLCYNGWTKADDVSDNFPVRGPSRVKEDVSHGHLDVTMAAVAYRAGIGVGPADLARLHRSLTQRVFVTTADGRRTVSQYVDGSGRPGNTGYEQMVPSWLAVAAFGDTAAAIRGAADRLEDNAPVPDTVPIYAIGYLNWAARTGARLR